MLKPLKTNSNWGSTEFQPSNDDEKLFITVSGPRGGDSRTDWINPIEALGIAAYLKCWALENLQKD